MFRVVPDQLKISDGWVRCGHCADVFDATLYLEAWVPPPPPPSPPVPEPEPEPAPVPVPVQPEPEAEPAQALVPEPGPEPERQFEPAHNVALPDGLPDAVPDGLPDVLSGGPAPDPAAGPDEDPESDFHADLRRFAQKSAVAQAPVEEPAPPPLPAPAVSVLTGTDEEPQEIEAAEPGFVVQARRKAFWQSPLVRGLLSVLLLLLTLLLAGQWVLYERDRLAAAHPALRPLLAQACEPLGCELAPLRRIDAVVIDSSTLTRRLGSFYGFDFVLKNNADLPLAVPALELSLTNSRDEVLSRRVFLPSELPGAPAQLPPNASVSLSLRLSIAVDGPLPMAGYRALVFYP